MKVFSRWIRSIKQFLSKFNYSPYVKDYLFTSNVKSSIFVSVIVAAIEIWMLILMMAGVTQGSNSYSRSWILQHTIAYSLLLAIAVIMLIYSITYLRGLQEHKRLGFIIKLVFTLAMTAFGIYVSYTSLDQGGQVFAFMTVIVFTNCLLTWQPVTAFFMLSISFLIYLYFQSKIIEISYSIKINSFTVWIAFVATTISTHHQKRVEAQKDEQLLKLNEYLKNKSLVDELTTLPNMNYFYRAAGNYIQNPENDISKIRFVFMDVENFKNYNEKYGFRAGTNFLRIVAQIVRAAFPDELVARFSDDHFVALADRDGLEEKIGRIQEEIHRKENSVQLGLKVGFYRPKERLTSPTIACDHARYACESIKKHYGHDFIEYDDLMSSEFKLKQRIINNIDLAIENKNIEVYYQPVVWAKDGKLCGVEALARWNDPQFGLLSPAAFVPVLEEYHLIHKLDLCIMDTVCQDIQERRQNGEPVIPASINFSRLDFELINPAEELNRSIKKYGLSKEDIHVEITESALSSSDAKMQESLESFRQNGYSLWLDDFGSGYSGLNVLKDYSFDMMKIDMAFLSKFSENKKSQPIITSVVGLAQKIGMQTLSEGVETQEAYDFLKSIGCQRLQGYLFGKPMKKSDFMAKIKDGTYDVSALRQACHTAQDNA